MTDQNADEKRLAELRASQYCNDFTDDERFLFRLLDASQARLIEAERVSEGRREVLIKKSDECRREWIRAERTEGRASELAVALKLFTSPSMTESRPTRGESFIGWQKGDGLNATERLAIAREALSRFTAPPTAEKQE